MRTRLSEIWKQRRLYLPGAAGMLAAFALICYFLTLTYRDYREDLIGKEQEQLLTVARTVGNGLVSFVDQELDSMSLYFASLEAWNPGDEDTDAVRLAEAFLERKRDLYDAAACYASDGTLLGQIGTMNFAPESLPQEKQAALCGKNIGPDGWYQMFVCRGFSFGGKEYRAVYAMNLNRLYEEIVRPVRIGEGGYSVVKDQNLDIIMHHAASQIGMDAIKDRSAAYPQLDLTSLSRWIEKQENLSEGCDVIDTYVWDDPELSPVRRIVAYTTIDIQGSEKWIVNSTLPYKELQGPLLRMLSRLMGISLLFFCVLTLAVFAMTRSMVRAAGQKKELEYLREINSGMELLRRKDEEIQHYQRVQSIGQMSSHIAHEFNNYLTPVLVYGELLESDPEATNSQKELVRGILKAADQAASLSRRLLDFSRQDSDVVLVNINLAEDVKTACTVLGQLAPSDVKVSCEIQEERIFISGRRGMVEHILMNLGNNAFHAMEKVTGREKSLTVRLREAENPEKDGDAGKENLRVCLSVTDTGCGIPKDALDKIFEPFYTTKRSGKGTGLGLSVVRNVVTACGGQIRIESTPDQGTTFLLYFPRVQEKASGEAAKPSKIRRVFVADDEKEVLASLAGLLKQSGFQCECFDHPAALLTHIQNQKNCCDLILTDYAMPSMNGLELAELVRKLSPDIRIFLMSGMEDARFEWYLKNRIIDRFFLKTDLRGDLIPALRGE